MKPHPWQAILPYPLLPQLNVGESTAQHPRKVWKSTAQDHRWLPASKLVSEVKPVCHPYFKDYPIRILHLLLRKQPRLGEVNYLRKSHLSDPQRRKRMGSLASVKCTSQLRNNEYKISLRANMWKPQNPMAPLLTPPPCHPAKHTRT